MRQPALIKSLNLELEELLLLRRQTGHPRLLVKLDGRRRSLLDRLWFRRTEEGGNVTIYLGLLGFTLIG